MAGDYKKLLTKKKKKTYCDIKTMGVDIDKNEYYEIKLSQSNHPEVDKNEYYEIKLSQSNHPEAR